MEATNEAISNYKYYADLFDETGESQDLRQRNRWGKKLIKILQENITPETRFKLTYTTNGIRKGIMLTPRSIDKFRDKILTGIEVHREFDTGSDVIDNFNIHDIESNINIEEVERANRNNDGFYFKYYNLTQFDLSKYQIYTKQQTKDLRELNDEDMNEHCLYLAFKNSNILTEEQLFILKTMLVEGNCPKSRLTLISKKLNIQITLTEYLLISGKISLKYINKGDRKNISIALFKDHYFINDIINVHLFGARNWNKIEHNKHPRFNEILSYKTRYTYEKEYNQKALTVIKELFDNKGFEEFKFEDHYKDINFEMTYKQDIKLIDRDFFYNLDHTPYYREQKPANNYENIYFADFETTTQDLHKAHTVAWCHFIDKNIKSAKGNHCVETFLENLKNKSIVYFHNLKYDWQQIFGNVYIIKATEKDNQLYKMTVKYFDKTITFKDSYKMISSPLRDFSEMFKLEITKDIMPYDLYTQDNINNFDESIDLALQYIKDKDKEDFIKNIDENNFRTSNNRFRHMEYSLFYCKKDVELLTKGFIMFRDLTFESLKLNVFDYLSISSLADDYLINQDCYQDVWPLKGTVRTFVQQTVIGGKVCSKDNKKWHLKENVQDFDAVALYPSSMSMIEGFPKGLPKKINCFNWDVIKNCSYYCLEIVITKQKEINYGIPIMTYVESDSKKRIWTNNLIGKQIIVDKTTLEDYIKYYSIEFTIIQGVYWNDGFNNNINETMEFLFQQRKKYKEEKNPIQIVYKLLMNSAYGKTILKESKESITYIYNIDKKPNAIEDFVRKNYNLIKYEEEVPHQKLKCMKYYMYKNKFDHKNYCHLGTYVLSMSKRIMNQVNEIAHENNVEIYYVDTDSMHIKENQIELLSSKFKEKHSKELIGKDMGQFHCDFNSNVIKSDIKAIETIILGPKAYYDLLEGKDENGNLVNDNHIRLKGVDHNTIKETSKIKNKSIRDLYIDLYNGETIEFDLVLGGVKMQYVSGGIINRKQFIRKIKF